MTQSERKLRFLELEDAIMSADSAERKRLTAQKVKLSLEAAQERVQAERARREGVSAPHPRISPPAAAPAVPCAFCGGSLEREGELCPNAGPDWPHPPVTDRVNAGGQS